MHDVLKTHAEPQSKTAAPRLLFAVFQTGRLANGGVESMTAVITALTEYERLVVTNRETPFCARWREAGARVVVWDLPYEMSSSCRSGGLWRMARRAWSLVATNLQVARWVWHRRIDVIHSNDPAPFWHVAPAAKLTGVPLIFNLRDTKSAEERLDVARYRRRFGWAARVLVLSHEMRTFYRDAVRSPASVVINAIYSAVDFTRLHPLPAPERAALRERLGIPPDMLAVGFLATFNDKKNQLGYLRECVPALRRLCPNAHTWFVGDFAPHEDDYARKCAGVAAQEGLDSSVTFVGYTPDVADWYRACDLVVVPTRKEGLARCMIEALACGTPVVSFDVCSAREILETHECGVVVRCGDYDALAKAVHSIATDAPLLERLRTNALATARRFFAPARMVEDYRRLYRDVQKEGAC